MDGCGFEDFEIQVERGHKTPEFLSPNFHHAHRGEYAHCDTKRKVNLTNYLKAYFKLIFWSMKSKVSMTFNALDALFNPAVKKRTVMNVFISELTAYSLTCLLARSLAHSILHSDVNFAT